MSDSLQEQHCTVHGQVIAIQCLRDGTSSSFDLGSVHRVTAYKLDLFSFDQVRVRFDCLDGAAFDISEDDAGFSLVMTAAESALVGLSPVAEWKPSVTAEPFAVSETCLWSVLPQKPTMGEQPVAP
ncbi:MAG: hypothetical protein V4675_24670 [Verrucomicrobiota bacterium]